MSHVVFAAPDIERWHLHERLGRELRARGHRTTLLCVDPVAFTFFAAQDAAAVMVLPGEAMPTEAPLWDLARDDCRWHGRPTTGSAPRRSLRTLQRTLPGLLRFLEHQQPDLVLLHARRDGMARLIQFVAEELGIRVLWTGDGVLPHTLQIDDRGLDGEATARLRRPQDYLVVDGDEAFCHTALAALLGRSGPPALTRRPIRVPPLRARLQDSLGGLLRRHPHGALRPLSAWRNALPATAAPTAVAYELPRQPFAAVLLQDPADPRLRLDAVAPPDAALLVAAAQRAAAAVDPSLQTVAILPPSGLPPDAMAGLRRLPDVRLEVAAAAPAAAATAAFAVTINHPLGCAALLADTPLLHLGQALYGIPGVATATCLDGLEDAMPAALRDGDRDLRRSFLTWLLQHGHVWCSGEQPDQNGIAGLVQCIEHRLQERAPAGLQLRYRAGPSWPLLAEGSSP